MSGSPLFIIYIIYVDSYIYETLTGVQLPYSGIATGNRLYATDYNYMDFNVDEVGLWVIYSTLGSNNTLVAKVSLSLSISLSVCIRLYIIYICMCLFL